MQKAGVKALIYTSPSHEPLKPRWRVLCPFSAPLNPNEREHMVKRLNGIFEIDRHIASGGMGEIYRGHVIETGDPVAIKVMRTDLGDNATALALFRKEASALHYIHHEAIVRYYIFSHDPGTGRHYLAMEFVDGQPLSELLERGPLGFEAVCVLKERLAAGLNAAHQHGIVHRDLSPDNVLIPAGDLANAKIIDFRREPMACCFSNLKQLFAGGQEFTYSIEDIGRYYRTYLELMGHWDAVLPGRVLQVSYEDVVEDLEGNVRRILEFCGLELEPACVEFYKTQRSIRTASSEQVRQPIFREGLYQWRNYEGWLSPLKNTLGGALIRYRE